MANKRTGWQPIETYDKLKKKPEWAVFYVEETQKKDARYSLRACLSIERHMGNRVITRWMRLDPPEGE